MTWSLLAHAGPGASWQALVTVVCAGLGIVFLLAAAGRVRLEEPRDLTVPLASVAVLTALAPVAGDTLSDATGYAVPAGAVLLAAIVLAAATRLPVFRPAGIAIVVVVAVAASLLAGPPLYAAWHPPPPVLPRSDDAVVEVVQPVDGATVPAGRVTFVVRVDGGSLGPPAAIGPPPAGDPEEAGRRQVWVDGELRPVTYEESCTSAAPCTEVTFDLDLEPGTRTVAVELASSSGLPLAPPVADLVVIEVAGGASGGRGPATAAG